MSTINSNTTFPKMMRDAIRGATTTKERSVMPIFSNISRNMVALPSLPSSPRSHSPSKSMSSSPTSFIPLKDSISSPTIPASSCPRTCSFRVNRRPLSPLKLTTSTEEVKAVSLDLSNSNDSLTEELTNNPHMNAYLSTSTSPTPSFPRRSSSPDEPEDVLVCAEAFSPRRVRAMDLEEEEGEEPPSPRSVSGPSTPTVHNRWSTELVEHHDIFSIHSSGEDAESVARDRCVSFGALFPPRHNAHLTNRSGLLQPTSSKLSNNSSGIGFASGRACETSALGSSPIHNSTSFIRSIQQSIPPSFRCIGKRKSSFMFRRRQLETLRLGRSGGRREKDEGERYDYPIVPLRR